MEEQQNPEKIPMNPVQDAVPEKQLFESPHAEPVTTSDQVMKNMFKRSKQEPAIPLKYSVLLAVMMIIFVIVAYLVGRVLFRNGLI
jgi:hypothetical protein